MTFTAFAITGPDRSKEDCRSAGRMMHTFGHETSRILVLSENKRDTRAHKGVHDRQDFAAGNTECMTAPSIE